MENIKFELGQKIEFEALYRDDSLKNNFSFEVIKRTPKTITVRYDSLSNDTQKFMINQTWEGYEFIVINHIVGYELARSKSVYAQN